MSDSTLIGEMVASMLETQDGLKLGSAVLACHDVELTVVRTSARPSRPDGVEDRRYHIAFLFQFLFGRLEVGDVECHSANNGCKVALDALLAPFMNKAGS
jgi:hypothetical protein